MTNGNRGLLGLVGAAAMLALVPQAAQAGTVVASSGPSANDFPVGTQIGDTQRIALEAGDALTVLDDGGTRVLRGPGTFVLARQSGQTRNRAFAALTTQRSAARARTGAVRNTQTGQEVRNPNLWYVNIAASGTMCLNDSSTIRFWRADTVGEAVYSLAPAAEPGEATLVSFPEREMLATWDAGESLREGEPYTIGMAPRDAATQVSFVFLDTVPEEPEALAQTLLANGCTGQVEQLAAAMMEG